MQSLPNFSAEPYHLPAELTARLLTPALFIHRRIVAANIDCVLKRLDGRVDRWRPHLKTTKSPDLWRLLLERGVSQFKCATTREAAVLLETAAAIGERSIDLLVAYPHVEPALGVLATLAHRYPQASLSVLVESPSRASRVPTALSIFAELDIGMHRTGLSPERWGEWLTVAPSLGTRFRGLHGYDGHWRDPDPEVRSASAAPGYDALLALAQQLERAGAPVREIMTSGTPGLTAAIAHQALGAFHSPEIGRVHRVSAGTVVLHDAGYEAIVPELGLTPAAVVMSRVISRPMSGRITLDAGSKSIAAEVGDPCVAVAGHPRWRAQTPSEEHLPIDLGGDEAPAPGEMVALIPRHICPTVNLAEQAVLVMEDRTWRVIDIAARAHELLAPEP